MSVMVYSRLGDLLRDKNVTVRDLQQRLAARFGLMVAVRTLDRLARTDRVRRPDLELAAASAEVLGVGLSEIFAVETAVADKEVQPNADGLGDTDWVILWSLSRATTGSRNYSTFRTVAPSAIASRLRCAH